MATALEGLVSSSLRKLCQLIQDEALMILNVDGDITRLQENLENFRTVCEDAEYMVMMGDESLKLWWKRVSDVMFNVEDVMDIFTVHLHMRDESSPSCSMFSCFVKLPDDHTVGTRIKNINAELDFIKSTTEMYNPGYHIHPRPMIKTVDTRQTTPIVEPEVVGTAITSGVDSMVQAIRNRCNESKVFGIEGMGGIGKTTLAQKIYWEQRIRNDFQIHIWLCISETYTETTLLKQAIEMAGGDCGQLDDIPGLQKRLKYTLQWKSVFLVLDDVCKSDVWLELLGPAFSPLLNVCVLVTTRSHDVLIALRATEAHIHKVGRMSEIDGLMLLMKNSSAPSDDRFQELGRDIVQKCDGLPLAIKAIAGILCGIREKEEWVNIRDSLGSVDGLPKEVVGALYISYRNLSYELKQCFLWCALLPPNFGIHRDAVSYWWVAEGFVSKVGPRSIHKTAERYYYELIRRNLLQPKPEFVDEAVSTMHDVLRSLGQYLTKDHSLYMKAENGLSTFMNVRGEVSRPNLRRLGIATDVKKLPALGEHKCLRTLQVFFNQNIKSVPNDIFRKLQHVRVLILSGTSIQDIPESVGHLVLLKLLDLSDTEIKKLPKSTGSLISLEYLCLRGCNQLRSLPASLMGLCKITFLELEDTALHHVPKGIENFKQLYNLRGVFESETGFKLDELQCLHDIHRLWVTQLEKATPGGEHVLKNSGKLIELGLCCTMSLNIDDRTSYSDGEVQKIKQVYDKLTPPEKSSLQYVTIGGFPSTTFPEWLCSKAEHYMPDLQHMHLNECISCTELPPAGQMPQLKVLQIKGADAVETIGTELLGKGVGRLGTPAVYFPELVLLHIFDMCSLHTWSLNTGNPRDNMEGDSPWLFLMPKLIRLYLLNCAKLAALPSELSKLANLRRIHIEGADELKEIVELPEVVWLMVKKNARLRRISSLGRLQDLLAQDCPLLDRVDDLPSLKRVYVIDCPDFRNCLPREGVQFIPATDGHNIFPDETLSN